MLECQQCPHDHMNINAGRPRALYFGYPKVFLSIYKDSTITTRKSTTSSRKHTNNPSPPTRSGMIFQDKVAKH